MDTSICRRVAARPALIFSLAAHVEDWPRLLPHYRWVRIVQQRGPAERIVDMAARRQVTRHIAFPLRWTSTQQLEPERGVIGFEHIAGISRGMRVTWAIRADPADPRGSLVVIRHVFSPHWPVPDSLLRMVVGEYFVNAVARRTLSILGDIAATNQRAERVTASRL